MQYATVQDLVDRFGEREMIQLTDLEIQSVQADKVQRAIDDAQAFADAYVGKAYSLPLTGCTKPAPAPGDVHAVLMVPPPQLTRIVCDVARYYLYQALAPEHEVYLRYKADDLELQAIDNGAAVLACPWGGSPGTLVSGTAPGEGEVLYGFSPRRVTDDDLRGYA